MSSQRESYRTFDRGRGSGRGRGGRGSWRGGPNFNQGSTAPPPPLGPTIDRIEVRTLMTEVEAPKINHVEYLASYNWLNGASPTILVPGSPPAWSPPASDSKLPEDSEDVFRDINSALYASYPLEPAVRSLQVMKPDYDLQDVDVVGCGSTIGNLMRFAMSETKKAFGFDAELIGDTVLFIRREISPTELIRDLYGYGHTFPEAYTAWDSDVRNSCSHQRIIGYDFGGLKFLVRTETDAYLRNEPATETPEVLEHPRSTDSAALPSLEDAFGSITVDTTPMAQDGKLEIKNRGVRVPQSQIFDIKTRASRKNFDMNDILPRLWLNQTPNFLIAYHQSGLFSRPEVKDIREDILKWERDNSSMLALFHAVVKRIIDVMFESDNPRCQVSWDGHGPLCITESVREGNGALPPDLVQLLQSESPPAISP